MADKVKTTETPPEVPEETVTSLLSKNKILVKALLQAKDDIIKLGKDLQHKEKKYENSNAITGKKP